ncbi:hypothetical protein [Enterococcus gallinarum]|uniref:Uncharacterized protein n=1 Tax=Enterococcus gallinarum TaxID=1353 RepID=A0A6I4XHM6_ENTGA|nr:hypothetical protein [Enterococcus gallinarum]MXS25279.1 hypothetical protein [Enterococcus gallinarum]DAG74620.1 MAG TPA: Short C-terminal domain [Caudoviricetes sp.]
MSEHEFHVIVKELSYLHEKEIITAEDFTARVKSLSEDVNAEIKLKPSLCTENPVPCKKPITFYDSGE